jgi:branched-chain amino acid transport system permease protein
VDLLGTSISTYELLIIVLAPLLMGVLILYLKKTKRGLAIRAVQQNLDFARLVGVNTSMIYMLTFGLGGSLAGIAGSLVGCKSFIEPKMGSEFLLKAFVVIILGGLGNISGTIGAAYVVGLLEAMSTNFLGLYWTPAVLFLIMILVMIFKPTGLFGER